MLNTPSCSKVRGFPSKKKKQSTRAVASDTTFSACVLHSYTCRMRPLIHPRPPFMHIPYATPSPHTRGACRCKETQEQINRQGELHGGRALQDSVQGARMMMPPKFSMEKPMVVSSTKKLLVSYNMHLLCYGRSIRFLWNGS